MNNLTENISREEKIRAVEEILAKEKSKGFKQGVIIGVVVATIMLNVFALLGLSQLGYNKGDGKLRAIERLVNKYYLFDEEISEEAVKEATYKGLVGGLGDPYSAYLNKEEFEQLSKDMEGEFCGVGIVFTIDQTSEGSFPKVVSVIPGNSADREGIKSGDMILEVEGKSIRNLSTMEIGEFLKGDAGSKVSVTIKRESTGKVFNVTLTREKIKDNTVFSKVLDKSIGYIQIKEFEKNTSKDFKKAIDNLMEKNVKGLILDVRDNPGGMMDATLEMLDYLLPKGKLVTTVGKDGKEDVFKAKSNDSIDLPIAVLINGGSASASELFTGTLQDYNKAFVIGTKSFGKGIVQNIYPLTDGSAVKITIAEYLTAKGRHLHKKGVTPDMIVKDSRKTQLDKNDIQLEKAKEYIGGKIK